LFHGYAGGVDPDEAGEAAAFDIDNASARFGLRLL